MKGSGEAIEEHPVAGTKVLLVASHASSERQVEAAFRRAGYTLVPCETFTEARLALREQRHAMVIVDRALSDGAGLDLLASATSAPVIVLSDELDVHARLSVLRAGAVDCVGKPYDPLHLVARAVSVLNVQKGMPAVASPGFARRLLVVDDSVSAASTLAEELRKDGHDVALARAAHEALAFGAVQEIDLAIVDALLPDMSGVELRGRLRAIPALRRMPVLVLLGEEETAFRGSFLEGEPSDILVHRHDLDAVRMQVRRMLSRDERQAPSSRRGALTTTYWSVPPPPSQRSVTPPASQRSVPPPPSQRTVPPPTFGRDVSPPAFGRDLPPPSQRTLAPPPSQRSVPPPPSQRAPQRTVPPPAFGRDVSRDGPPSSRRFVPASSRHSAPAPASSRHGAPAPASSRHGAPAPASSRHSAPAPASSRHGAAASSHRPPRHGELESSLLEQLVAASGLSRLVARGAIERACQRIGVPASRLTRQDIERLVPEMEQSLRVFLPADAVAARMAEMARLAGG